MKDNSLLQRYEFKYFLGEKTSHKIIENVKKFGLPVAVAVNHFVADTEKEVNELIKSCEKLGVKATLCTHWANGGEGTKELASHVVELIDKDEAKLNSYMKTTLHSLKK